MSLDDIDRSALISARTHAHSPPRDRAVATFSRFGEHGAGWVLIGIAAGTLSRNRDRRSRWFRGARTIALSYALNQTLKVVVRRQRPELPGLPPLTSTVSRLSFPSAHATTGFAGARAYRGLAPSWLLETSAILLALSRVYLGVHYPSDVIAGAILGTAVSAAAAASSR